MTFLRDPYVKVMQLDATGTVKISSTRYIGSTELPWQHFLLVLLFRKARMKVLDLLEQGGFLQRVGGPAMGKVVMGKESTSGSGRGNSHHNLPSLERQLP